MTGQTRIGIWGFNGQPGVQGPMLTLRFVGVVLDAPVAKLRPPVAVKANGDLYLYRGNGLGGFSGAGTGIGGGWGGFGALFSPGDFTGDGRSDVLAVKANGDLYLYRGNGLGRFTGPGTLIAPA